MSFFISYLLVTLLSSKAFFIWSVVLICAFIGVSTFITLVITEDREQVKNTFINSLNPLRNTLYISLALALLIPSVDDAKLIVGAAVTYEVITSETIQALPEKTMKAVDLFLDKMEIDIETLKTKQEG